MNYIKKEDGTDHCFVSNNTERRRIYTSRLWDVTYDSRFICTEIDECLETYHVCGDPNIFENECANLMNDYKCYCGNFTERGYPNDPCDDHRVTGHRIELTNYPFGTGVGGVYSIHTDLHTPHTDYSDNVCQWVNNSYNYSLWRAR